MGEKRLVTELVTMLVIDGKKGESQGRIKDIRKPAIPCGLRVSFGQTVRKGVKSRRL